MREICDIFYDSSWHEGYNDNVDSDILKKYENSTCVVGFNSVGGGPVGNLYDILKSYNCRYIFLAYLGDSDSNGWLHYNKHVCSLASKVYFRNFASPGIDKKFFGIPLGVDFWTGGYMVGYKLCDAMKQLSLKLDELNNSNIDRKLQIYNDYHTTTAHWGLGDFTIRKKCLKYMEENIDLFRKGDINIVITKERLSRDETFKNYRQSTFILSPPGNGYDCHRHFEALVLGAIPIIIRTPLLSNDIYHGLPIIEIDKIEDLTPELLLSYLKNFKLDRYLLTVEYWKNKVRELN